MELKNVSFLVFLFVVLITTQRLFAQADTSEGSIVYNRNGSVFVGDLLEANSTQIVLLGSTGDTVHLDKHLIRRALIGRTDILLHNRGKYHLTKGLYASVSGGIAATYESSATLDFIVGYRMDEKFSFGAGTGYHLHETELGNSFLINKFVPAYIYGRRYLGNSSAGPFVFSKLGYGFPIESDFNHEYKGGVYAQPGFGLHFASRTDLKFLISLSQYIQHSNGQRRRTDLFSNPVNIDYSIWYLRLMFNLTIEFG